MKKYLYILGIAASLLNFTSCSEDDLDPKSIFEDQPTSEQNDFDKWILANYTMPYNIALKYHMEDIESNHDYTLAPADYDKSVKLAHIVKYAWLETYDEVAGIDFTRQYVPKVLHLVGSAAYEDNGTMVLGTAEGGLKVTLYLVNNLKIDADFLNEYYFKTMHHEFAHILHQKRNFDPSFNRISEGKYVGADWYYYMTAQGAMPRTDDVAWPDGFVTAYAMSQSNEDFVENIAMYVTHTQAYWDNMMTAAGESGAAIINKKFTIVYNYMRDTWGIDLNELRKIVLRRQQEITEIDLSTIQ